MTHLPSLKGHEVIQALTRCGFYFKRQRGSHVRLFHRDKPELKITVPVHSKDLPENTLKRILKQADLSEEEFLNLLK